MSRKKASVKRSRGTTPSPADGAGTATTRRKVSKKKASGRKTKATIRGRAEKAGPRAGPGRAAAEPGRERSGISDESVEARTGLRWAQWFRLLDRAGSLEKSHKEIARWLHDERAVSEWWAQRITVAYEQERGLREVHQKCDGGWEANGSKTLPVPIEEAYRAWSDARRRERWLADPSFSVRKATPHKSMRITWGDGVTHVDVSFTSKGPEKCAVQVQHRKLEGAADVKERKAYWKSQLGALAALLGG